MIRGGKTVVCVLGCLVLTTETRAVLADVPDNSYRGIVERNVFGLKPPPPPPPPPTEIAPPTKLTLTGITTILKNKRALLSAQTPNKPMESYILAEGQRDREVEVLEIDEKAGSVKVNNHGIIQTLDFKTDGAKLQITSMPGLPPPGMAAPYSPIPPPPPGAMNPSGQAPATLRTIPTRTMRIPPPPGTAPQASPESIPSEGDQPPVPPAP